jgi:hypothetical protein
MVPQDRELAGKIDTDLAEQEGVTDAYVCRLLPLTCSAPDIVEAILDGRQPRGLRLREMLGNGPVGWEEQRRAWASLRSPEGGPSASASSSGSPCPYPRRPRCPGSNLSSRSSSQSLTASVITVRLAASRPMRPLCSNTWCKIVLATGNGMAARSALTADVEPLL